MKNNLKERLEEKNIKIFQIENKVILFNPYNLKKVFTSEEELDEKQDEFIKELSKKPIIQKPVLSNIKVIVSTACNFRCEYCLVYKNRKNVAPKLMGKEMADRIIEFYNEKIKDGVIVFTGGEPLTNWKIVNYFLDHVKAKFIIQTNGALITEEIAKKFKEKNVLIILSMDGDDEEKNSMRKLINGDLAYDSIIKGYKIAKEAGCSVGVSFVSGYHNL